MNRPGIRNPSFPRLGIPGFFIALALFLSACSSEEEPGKGGPEENPSSSPTPAPLVFTSDSVLEPALQRTPYEAQIQAQGGTPPYRFEVVSTYPPWGLRLDPETGILSGTPSWRGDFSFDVRVQDAAGQSLVDAFSLSVSRWNPVTTIGCGESISLELSASATREGGGHQLQSLDEAAFFSLQLPPEETTLMIVRAIGYDGSDPALFLGRTKEAPGSTRVAYYYRRAATPGDENVRIHDATSPSLADYREHGSNIAMALAATVPGRFTLEVACFSGPVIVDDFLPNAPPGALWSHRLTGLNTEDPPRFSAPEGLPEGLNLSEDGLLSGQIDTPGLQSIHIALEDATGKTDERDLSLWTPEITTMECGMGPQEIFLETQAFNARAGLSTYGGAAFFALHFEPSVSEVLFSISAPDHASAALFIGAPGSSAGESRREWMARTLYDSAVRDETPTTLQLDNARYPPLQAFDGVLPFALAAVEGTGTIRLEVDCDETLQTASPSLPAGRIGDAYAFNLEASGGKPPYTWETSSLLPEGLILDEEGLLEGSPIESGIWTVDISVYDAEGAQANADFHLSIGDSSTLPGCGALPDLSCGDIIAVTFENTQWEHRLAFRSDLDPFYYCLKVPEDIESVEIEVESSEGDPDVFLTWPGIAPGDPNLDHYYAFAAFDGDDTLRIDDTTSPRLSDFGGVAGIMVGAYLPGYSYISIHCD